VAAGGVCALSTGATNIPAATTTQNLRGSSDVLKGHDFSRAAIWAIEVLGFSP
jgi:hypothetical protein